MIDMMQQDVWFGGYGQPQQGGPPAPPPGPGLGGAQLARRPFIMRNVSNLFCDIRKVTIF